MVTGVRTILFLLNFAYITIGIAQTDETTGLTASLNTNQVELGKHVNLTLSAPTTVSSTKLNQLDTIDLSKLKSLFHVETYSDIELEAGKQNWQIRLTPYHKGKQTIPVLTFSDLKSNPIEITVTDAIDSKSRRPMTISYSASTLSPWVREQVLVIYKLNSSLKLYDLKLDEPDLVKAIMHELEVKETIIQNNDNDTYDYQTGYALFNLTDGQQKINLPPLIVRRDGTTTHRFYPPPFELTVKALPLYLPATVPVGKLSLESDKSLQFSFTYRLTNTELILAGHHMPFSSLPDIGYQFISTDSLQTYPAAQEEIYSNKLTGLTRSIQYTLPLKPISQGLHTLKPVRLLSFDPDRGTLQTNEYNLPTLFSLNIWASITLILLFSLFCLIVLYRLYRYLSYHIKRYRYYKLALRHLTTAKDRQSIRSALQLIAEAEGDNGNHTPQQWLKLYASKSEETKLKEPLNQLFYLSSDKQNILTLTQDLIQTIKNKHILIY